MSARPSAQAFYTGLYHDALVTLFCDKAAVTPILTAAGENPPGVFYFRLASQCACANVCSASADTSPSSSTVLALAIILSICLAGYAIVCALFVRNKIKNSDKGHVTNREFCLSAIPSMCRGHSYETISGPV